MQQSLIDYALAKPGAEASFPFGPEALVFKVMGKIFALTSQRESLATFNLKCDPERAIALRAAYPAVKPGYHMNKQHWNTLELDGSLTVPELQRMIDHSYDLVVRSLTKAERQKLAQST